MQPARTPFGLEIQTPRGAIPIRHIIGIGRNYADHAKEQGAALPTRPMTFTKNPATAILTGDDIIIPRIAQDPKSGGDQTDFEAELAVIIGPGPSGTFCKDIPETDAFKFILGYTAANDVSARWWQKEGSGGQFNRGKSFDTFCPLGPRIVPVTEIPDPQNLRITCRVNGQVMQDATTRDMIFPVARLIADLSRGTTLLPGTVILTGTPSGVGMARTPPAWLKHGDTVEVEIERIGVLTNRVRAESTLA
jgi:2-keto-4-pentenoate hydratase/2-oxohepta-3-ene-1,7-dioic acid hydratase in catechol pathway